MKDLIGERVYLPGQKGNPDKTFELVESDLKTSQRDVEILAEFPILKGIDIPTAKKGHLTTLDRERWLVAMEILLQRGVKNISEITRLTGLSFGRVDAFVKEVKERWSKSLTVGQVNARREAIYLEAERVKEACWETLNTSQLSDAARLAYFRMIIECGRRQSSLIGADRINVNVETTTTHKTKAEMEKEVASHLKISVEDLAKIGDSVSKQLSDARD